MIRAVRTMRSRGVSAVAAVLLGLAVLLMHTGMPMAAGVPGTVAVHHGAPPEAAGGGPAMDRADHQPSLRKHTVDAVHQHESHHCAGTVVVHKQVGAPSLVTVLPRFDGAPDPTPVTRAALARGPPPWTVLDLTQLCLLRV